MKKLIYMFVLLAAITGIISCTGKESETKPIKESETKPITESEIKPIAQITKIAGGNQDAVAELLGEPVSNTATKYGPKLIYQGDIEVVFIDGKADWITVPMTKVPYNKNAVKYLDLKPTNPSFSNNFTMRWEGISGLLQVSIFAGRNGKVDYADIKAFTK